MALTDRQADLQTGIGLLRTALANCNADVQAQDPDTYEIARLRERVRFAIQDLTGGLPA